MLIGAALLISPVCRAQADVKITSLTIGGDGKVNVEIDGPAGEYIVECTQDLQPNNWTQLSRLLADGSSKDYVDPYDLSITSKFYRILIVPPADEFHLTGEFAAALEAALSFSDLQNIFGLNFTLGEATIPAGNDLSQATRNARIYSAVIATLSTLAKDLRDDFPAGSQPSAATIAAALIEDMKDGNLDGNNNGTAVPIGTTGSFLPAYTEQDFLNALNEVKTAIPGLYNVFFTASGAGAASASSGTSLLQAAAVSGIFTPSTPAVWGDFYWGSSDWQ